MSAGYHALMLQAYGKKIIPYTLTQAFYGVSLFEIVNYIEHYGLKRGQKADGSYERTLPEHSWNNNNIVTNLFCTSYSAILIIMLSQAVHFRRCGILMKRQNYPAVMQPC